MSNEKQKQPWYAEGDLWTLTQTSWEPSKSFYYETIFTQSNGYMGIRGYTEETNPGVNACREGYLAGIFGHVDDAAMQQLKIAYPWPSLQMLTLPELFAIALELDGEAFSLDEGRVESFARTLDMRNGVLTRNVRWVSPAGKRTRLTFKRFLSAAVPHLGVQHILITPENWSGTAILRFGLDSAYPSYFRCGDRAMAHLPQAIMQNPALQIVNDSLGVLTITTKGTGHTVSMASGLLGGATTVIPSSWSNLGQETKLKLNEGKAGGILHAFAVVSSRDQVPPGEVPDLALDIAREALQAGYDGSLADSETVWQHRWAMSDIAIEGPARDQAYIRFSAFSMLQMAPFHTDRLSVPARAYAYNRYHGLYYWDSETFLMPYYLHTHPDVAENLLSFRYHTLDGARRTASRLKSAGACYPWMTDAEDGAEQAPWGIGDYVWHQNADIAYAMDQFVQATGNARFMLEKGLPCVVESARFWMSRLEEDAAGVVHLHDTVGPDELDKHGKDNGYSSLMARRHLRLAAEWSDKLEALFPDEGREVTARLNAGIQERVSWRNAAARMAVPMVPGHDFPLQDEFLLAKKPTSFDGLTADEAFAMRHTHRVVKQADIIVAMYLLQDEFTVEQMRGAYDFYEPMTLHYSSLSYNTHSIIATKIGRDAQAYDYFMKAAGLDLDNLRDATKDGLHAAALGGTWQTITYGFLGMRLTPEAIVFQPRLPTAWKTLAIHIAYRGYRLKLTLSHRQHRVDVEDAEGQAGTRINLNGEVYELADGLSITSSPVHAVPFTGLKNAIQGVIFDLDGVIVSTDEYHYQAWKKLADEQGIHFTRHDNERLRGVSRMESLEIILQKATRSYTDGEKHQMAERKNDYYRESLKQLGPADILPGVMEALCELKRRGIKLAIGSSSKNAGPILRAVGLGDAFDVVTDGTHISRSKPDPEVFTLAGQRLKLDPSRCLVVEDAAAGVDAGLAAGMPVLAVGSAVTHRDATLRAENLSRISVDEMLGAISRV